MLIENTQKNLYAKATSLMEQGGVSNEGAMYEAKEGSCDELQEHTRHRLV